MTHRATVSSLLTAFLSLTLACGGGDKQPTEPPEPEVTTIEVTPDSAELDGLGATQAFEATAKDQNGNTISGVSFSWSVSPDSVASVDDEGTVTAEAEGTATVQASAAGITGSSNLTVERRVASVEVTPDSARLTTLQDTQEFDATAQDDTGRVVTGVSFRWSVSPDSVASIDESGVVTADGNGSAIVEAEAQGVAGSAHLTVDQEVDSLVVRPDSAHLSAIGDSQQFTATAQDRNGQEVAGADIGWGLSDSLVATIDSTGLVTSRQEGRARVVATSGAMSDSAMLRVEVPSGTLRREFRALEGEHTPKFTIAAAPTRILAVVQERAALLTKSGGVIASPRGRYFGGPEDIGNAEPRAIYDPNSGRFFLSYLLVNRLSSYDCEPGGCETYFALLVSKSSAPRSLSSSDWHVYFLRADRQNSKWVDAIPNRNRIGVTKNKVVLAATMVQVDRDSAYKKIRVLDKTDLVQGDSAKWTDLTLHEDPVTGDGRPLELDAVKRMSSHTELYFLSQPWVTAAGSSACNLVVWKLTGPPDDPVIHHAIAHADGIPGPNVECRIPKDPAPQPDGGPGLKIRHSGLKPGPQYQKGSLWFAHNFPVDVGDGSYPTGIRWGQIDVSGWPTVDFRQDTLIKAGNDTWMLYPAPGVTSKGDMAMLYAQSSKQNYQSLHVAYRDANENVNKLTNRFKVGQSDVTYQPSDSETVRFADPFGVSVDPVDRSIWFLGQLIATKSTWWGWAGNMEP